MWCVGRPVTSHGRSFRFIDQTLRARRESYSVPPRSAREARSEQSMLSQACNKPTAVTPVSLLCRSLPGSGTYGLYDLDLDLD